MRLNVPLKEILGSYNCYKDGQGNCYQNGQNGGGASLICKMPANQKGKCWIRLKNHFSVWSINCMKIKFYTNLNISLYYWCTL